MNSKILIYGACALSLTGTLLGAPPQSDPGLNRTNDMVEAMASYRRPEDALNRASNVTTESELQDGGYTAREIESSNPVENDGFFGDGPNASRTDPPRTPHPDGHRPGNPPTRGGSRPN